MAESTSNDNFAGYPDAKAAHPDPHGQAALLLIESLIHGLVARSVFSVEEAVEIVNVATEVKEDIVIELSEEMTSMTKSLTLLRAISASLSHDVRRD